MINRIADQSVVLQTYSRSGGLGIDAELKPPDVRDSGESFAGPFSQPADGADDSVAELGRAYFSLLDRQTNPNMAMLDAERVDVIVKLLKLLRQRIMLRGRAAREPGFRAELPPCPINAVRHISTLMIGILETSFGAPLINSDHLETIGAAHDLFSCGHLMAPPTPGIRVPNLTPDGAPIFFFPEFAHAALEHEVDAPVWRAMLPILTRMPALYVRAHELHNPASVPGQFDSFGLPPVSQVIRVELGQYALELKRRLDPLDVRSLANELGYLVSRTFCDSM